MATVITLYHPPTDPDAFDAHYQTRHLPLARTIPGLRSIVHSKGAVATHLGPVPCYAVDILTFEPIEAVAAAIASPEGRAAAADVRAFADGGCTVLSFADGDAP